MPEEYIPTPQTTPPSGLSLLDIIKAYSNTTGQEYSTRFTNINDLLSDSIEPLFENIQGDPYTNEELGAILTELVKQTLLIKSELYNQHIFNGKLIFELLNQGIKIEDKVLLNELKYIK